MQLQPFSSVSILIHTYTIRSCRRKSDDDRDTHIHTPMPTLDLTCVQTHTHTHTSRGASFKHFQACFHYTHTHKQLCSGYLFNDGTHIHTPIPITLDCLHKLIFLLHVYGSVSLTRMRRCTQLAYVFHQCATSLLSRDARIADCTLRHPCVELSFSSLTYVGH